MYILSCCTCTLSTVRSVSLHTSDGGMRFWTPRKVRPRFGKCQVTGFSCGGVHVWASLRGRIIALYLIELDHACFFYARSDYLPIILCLMLLTLLMHCFFSAAAAAAAAAQLAQVPPPEHLKFPVNDIQGPGVAASPSNDKVKRRRKRKIDFIECAAKSASSLSPQDEPPLKVVPHPVKYTSVAESGATDLKVTVSIVFDIPGCF